MLPTPVFGQEEPPTNEEEEVVIIDLNFISDPTPEPGQPLPETDCGFVVVGQAKGRLFFTRRGKNNPVARANLLITWTETATAQRRTVELRLFGHQQSSTTSTLGGRTIDMIFLRDSRLIVSGSPATINVPRVDARITLAPGSFGLEFKDANEYVKVPEIVCELLSQ